MTARTDSPRSAALFGSFVVVLGLQLMRFLFGSLTWYLRDTVGMGVLDLVPIALAPFLAGAVLPILSRRLGTRPSLWLGTGLLVVARVLNQVSDSPEVDLWAAGVGVAAFVGLLPLILGLGRSGLVGGVLLGLAIDTALRGATLSLDLAYLDGMVPLTVTAALGVGALVLLRRLPHTDRFGVGWGGGLTLLGIAPVLFFQMLVLQNQGWTAEAAGIGGPHAAIRIAVLNVVTLFLASRPGRTRWMGLGALVVFVAAAVAAEGSSMTFNVITLLAIPAAGIVWASLVPEPDRPGSGASSTYLVGGMTLFVISGLAYYVPIDLDLGITQAQVRLGIAALLGLIGLFGVRRTSTDDPGTARLWVLAAALVLLPIGGAIGLARSVDSTEAAELPLRVTTYNIHSSFNVDGALDVDAIAAVIEESGATVVGLQEIPRGRLISGVSDQLLLLQRRLGFEHAAFFGTTDPTWGNAILSRFPIEETRTAYLPLVGTPMQRGYLGATLDVNGESVHVISVHLQHVNDRAVHRDDPEADLYPVHKEQIGMILDTWDGYDPAVLVGDFNVRPEWQQRRDVLAAGWVDSWAEVGVGDGFTARSNKPRYRIDYVFHTAGLEATDATVIDSFASDHRALVVDLVLTSDG